MSNGVHDLPKLLSLGVHEMRTPMSVALGYLRMMLTHRAGPLNDKQTHMLEEAEKACRRMAFLLDEMSDLGKLESGVAPLKPGEVDLRGMLIDIASGLPPVPDRDMTVRIAAGNGDLRVRGDAARLKTAFTSLLSGLRRELVTSTQLLVKDEMRTEGGQRFAWIAIGDAASIDTYMAADPGALETFNEYRGGCGMSLVVARRVIEKHGGKLWSPGEEAKAGAVVMLPVG